MNDVTIYDEGFQTQLQKTATTLAKSSLLPSSLRGKPVDVFLIMSMGHDLGLKPTVAIQQICVIQGKPTMSAQLMVAMVKNRFPNAKIKYELLENASNPKAIVKIKENKDDEEWDYIASWDLDKATRMGIAGKDNYRKQPMNMLKWRAVSEAVRAVFPHALNGLYATEEFQDQDGKELVIVKNEIEEDFPIPEEEKEPGPKYRVQSGKFRGKQLEDVDTQELSDYIATLDKREEKTQLKQWEHELREILANYLMDLETVKID